MTKRESPSVEQECAQAWLRLRGLRTLADHSLITYHGTWMNQTHVVGLPGGYRWLARETDNRLAWRNTAWWWARGHAGPALGREFRAIEREAPPEMLAFRDVASMLGLTEAQLDQEWRSRLYYPLWIKGKIRYLFRANVEAVVAEWAHENGHLTAADQVGRVELARVWRQIEQRIPIIPDVPVPAPIDREAALDPTMLGYARRQVALDIAREHGLIVSSATDQGREYEIRLPDRRVEVMPDIAVEPWVLGAMDRIGQGHLVTYRRGL